MAQGAALDSEGAFFQLRLPFAPLSYVYNYATDKTALWILDAKDFSKEPIAKIQLPFRVPHGFHGTWVPMGA